MRDIEEVAAITIDCAYHVHYGLGPGLLESVYETVLTASLVRAGLTVERQKAIAIRYQDMEFADAFRADLLVEGRLVIEIKSVEVISKVHSKQLLTYLRLMQQPLGLLINFGSATFKEGIKRVVNNHKNFAFSRFRVNQISSAAVGREAIDKNWNEYYEQQGTADFPDCDQPAVVNKS